MSTPECTAPETITLTVTETIVKTYTVTPDQLAEHDLPTTVVGFENGALDADDIGLALEENFAGEYAVTEREVEASH